MNQLINIHNDPILDSLHMLIPLSLLSGAGIKECFREIQKIAQSLNPFGFDIDFSLEFKISETFPDEFLIPKQPTSSANLIQNSILGLTIIWICSIKLCLLVLVF